MKKAYVCILAVVFIAGIVVFCFFPRSTYSALEKRDLAQFPKFTLQSLFSGKFTSDVSSWFSDSEAYRDWFMALSMQIDNMKGIVLSEEDDITFHSNVDKDIGQLAAEEAEVEAEVEDDNRTIDDYENKITANENAKIAHSGIIIVGSGPKARALMAYGGSGSGGTCYSDVVNKYKTTFGQKVAVYCLVAPIATDFYLPDKAKGRSKPQLPVIRNIYSHLLPEVKAVDVYSVLASHVSEDIYLRTDHHWAPLGAYYAAKKFAEVAKVPFKDLSHYDTLVVHNVVGSMYGYSRDMTIKRAPEDFIYYVPKGVQYTTTYVNYTASKAFQVTGESKPRQGEFFAHFNDGNANAYCTFMGGDQKLTVVRTSTHNGRRLAILKDSYGNAIPSNLFYSFEEIHVIDFRYFTKNMTDYVKNNSITDILFVFNTFNSYSPSACRKLEAFLTKGSTIAKPDSTQKPSAPKPTAPQTEATGSKATTEPNKPQQNEADAAANPIATPEPKESTTHPTTTPGIPATEPKRL